jgi:thiol-disulfide isomerase/thioredoxin
MNKKEGALIVGAAVLAGLIGVAASIALTGPGPLLRTELGQRLLGVTLRGSAPAGMVVIEHGQTVPAMDLPTLQGEPGPLPTPGRPLLINYWATWCGPCREEMPLLARFSDLQSRRGIEVVGIALDNEAEARAFLREVPVPFRVVLETPGARDSSVRLGNRAGVLPYSVLVGADGKLIKQRFGAFLSAEDLHDWAQQGQ